MLPYNANWCSLEQITCLVNGTSVAHPGHPLAGRKLCGSISDPVLGRFPAYHQVLLNFSSDFVFFRPLFVIRYRMGGNGKPQSFSATLLLYFNLFCLFELLFLCYHVSCIKG